MRALAMMIAVMSVAVGGASSAEELRPSQGKSIHLGDVTGTAYYIAQPGGYEVVATMAAGETVSPIRFVATLNPGQSVTIAVPGEVGTPPAQIDFTRVGDQVYVGKKQQLARIN